MFCWQLIPPSYYPSKNHVLQCYEKHVSILSKYFSDLENVSLKQFLEIIFRDLPLVIIIHVFWDMEKYFQEEKHFEGLLMLFKIQG